MIVALTGDIHANLPALLAVLDDAKRRGAEMTLNSGDSVGYGAFPQEVVSLLRERKIAGVVGNYDARTMAIKTLSARRKPRNHLKILAFNWAYDRLSEAGREYLKSLPKEIRLTLEGKRLLLTHGSVESIKEYIDADTAQERLDELARLSDADIVVSGHSHLPFIGRSGKCIFINTGSVGRPDDGDPRACYALLTLGGPAVKVRHYRVKYDIQQASDAILQAGLPEQFAAMAELGRDLDYVLQDQISRLTVPDDPASPADSGIYPVPDGQAAPKEQTGPAGQVSSPGQTGSSGQAGPAEPAQQGPWNHLEVKASAMKLALIVRFEQEHATQVTRLALSLFDQLRTLHELSDGERDLLELAAILHDIGWVKGQKGHHKTSLEIIMDSPILKMDRRTRLIVGNIARYHRKALPADDHELYVEMNDADRGLVCKLAAMLRLADGLDRTHSDAVAGVSCKVERRRVTVVCKAKASAEPEKQTALDKSDLFEEVFGKRVDVKLGG
ncbi:MAG: metallophosphoesterase family protein [Planctomycetes bacterium]|nr:metallophosphoesterase family protein [Planctomycetota bacterium]